MTTTIAEKTLSYQSRLPDLPLPSLADTCSRYLESVKPFLDDKEYFQTEFQVNCFMHGPGKELHEKIKKLAGSSRNWLQDWWYDSYLSYRGPLPVISNIAGGIEPIHDFEKAKHGSQYQRAGLWLNCIGKQYLIAIRQEIPVQKLGKKYPMDMSQFVNMFCGGRIPGETRDTLIHHIHTIPKADGTMEVIATIRHVVVLMHGRIFKLKIFDEMDALLTPQNIERQLLKMKDICDKEGDGVSVGSLTAADRYTWFQNYTHLRLLDRQNKININVINEAIVAFAFDDIETYGLQDSAEHCILGDCINRWYDKTCCAVTSSTGLIGSSEDHIHLDGNCGGSILQAVYEDLARQQYVCKEEDITQSMLEPVELKFVVDDYILKTIKETQEKHRQLITTLILVDKPIPGYGKMYCKAMKIHPDTLMQMAIQLGYYSLHKKVASTYESGTSRLFYHGRTETVRSCTLQTKAWVESMHDDSCNNTKRRELFLNAVKTHNELMFSACNGQGIDRHLYVMKRIAEEEGIPLPGIYTDKAYKLSGGDATFVISTSLSGFWSCHGGACPMHIDGYGAFYNIEKHRINFNVSSWKASTKANCHTFHDSVVISFQTIHELLTHEAKL